MCQVCDSPERQIASASEEAGLTELSLSLSSSESLSSHSDGEWKEIWPLWFLNSRTGASGPSSAGNTIRLRVLSVPLAEEALLER
jgi:hypothetical protein